MSNQEDRIIVELDGYGLSENAKNKLETGILDLLKKTVAEDDSAFDCTKIKKMPPCTIGIDPNRI